MFRANENICRVKIQKSIDKFEKKMTVCHDERITKGVISISFDSKSLWNVEKGQQQEYDMDFISQRKVGHIKSACAHASIID